jgi:hypothetical protein
MTPWKSIIVNLVLQFSHDKKIQDERLMLQKSLATIQKRIELFPEGNVLPQGEGNWIPQIEYGQEWDARMGKWVE